MHENKQTKKEKDKDILKDQQVPYLLNVFTKDVEPNECGGTKNTLNADEIPLEVSQELILQDDSDVKTELVVLDDEQNNTNCENNSDVCENKVNVGGDVNINNVNAMAVSESEVNLLEPIREGPTLKMYQLDESILQVQAAGSQVTIRKFSKMTTNY